MRKRLLIQGATGSIGSATLDVVRAHRERFEVVGLAARTSGAALLDLAREFGVRSVALCRSEDASRFAAEARALGARHAYTGDRAVVEQAAETQYDVLVNALSGGAGLEPTVVAVSRGVTVALANKETLVAAGPLVLRAAARSGAAVIPIDSEHSAIYQCLLGEERQSVRRIWLTTSGGPFWGRRRADLAGVTVAETLAHPTWRMGPKITVDSATLFNKGLEVIEAERLFGVPSARIEVVAHRQSMVHSMVEFVDGSFKAQMSVPDMRLPILYALTYPDRMASDLVRTDPFQVGPLTFERVPRGEFPCLELAYQALARGGTAPAALSAADEIAVAAFLQGRICFVNIPAVLSEVLEGWPDEALADLVTAQAADLRARRMATEVVARLSASLKSKSCC